MASRDPMWRHVKTVERRARALPSRLHAPLDAPPNLLSREPCAARREHSASARSWCPPPHHPSAILALSWPTVTTMAPGKFSYKPLTLTPVNVSLTDGTAIPAPLDSPPVSPHPPPPGTGPLSSHPTPKSSAFAPDGGLSPGHDEADGAAADASRHHPSHVSDTGSLASPTSPTGWRPGSVRKFLGLRTLSSSDSLQSDRPGSPATISSQTPSLSRRKSGSWFGKRKTFAAGSVPEGNGTSAPYSNGRTVSQPAAPQSPPAPALPELKTLGVNDDTLGWSADDMFKNIGADDGSRKKQ